MESFSIVDVNNPWQALVAVIVVLGAQLFVWFSAHATNRLLKHETTSNSGQTLKDSLNRIEEKQTKLLEISAENTQAIAKNTESIISVDNRLTSVDNRITVVERSVRPQYTRKWRAFGGR